jgi:hypothetical protein
LEAFLFHKITSQVQQVVQVMQQVVLVLLVLGLRLVLLRTDRLLVVFPELVP